MSPRLCHDFGNNILDSVVPECYVTKRLCGSKGDFPYDEGKHLLAMVWHAYADDSGTHTASKYCLLLGYIGSPAQWKRVRREWRQVLCDIPEFKSTEFFQRKGWRSSESPYHGWSDKRAREFLNGLLSIIDRHDIWPIGGACSNADFYSHSTGVRAWLTGAILLTRTHYHEGNLEINERLIQNGGAPEHPYFVVFPGLLKDALDYTTGKRNPRIHFTLDRQGASEVTAVRAFNLLKDKIKEPYWDNLASITYAESHDEVGIQVADLYAYTWNRKLTGVMTSDLDRAYRVFAKKKASIMIVDNKSYFQPLLAWGQRDRESFIDQRITELT